jgi:hypothetical protein
MGRPEYLPWIPADGAGFKGTVRDEDGPQQVGMGRWGPRNQTKQAVVVGSLVLIGGVGMAAEVDGVTGSHQLD